MLWFKLVACSAVAHEFVPRSDIQVLKKQYVSSPPTREDSALRGASVTER